MPVLLIINNPGKAAAMTRWGIRFARSRDEILEIIFGRHSVKAHEFEELTLTNGLESEEGIDGIRDAIRECECIEREPPAVLGSTPLGSGEGFAIRLRRLRHPRRFKILQDEIKVLKPSLLILGKHESARTGNPDSQLARELFETTHCETILLRPGSSDGSKAKSILVPTSGGPHSLAAMREAVRISEYEDGEITPLYVEPDADEFSDDVGLRILLKLMKRAGVKDTETVHPRVVLNSNVNAAIQDVVAEGYDMLLLGQTHHGNLRRMLFGAVPERLMRSGENITIAVFKNAAPVGHRLRGAVEKWLSLRVPQLEREDRIALGENLQMNSQWNFDFMALICLSTAIASLGLILNSGAVVIGAMLVAPLMTPLLGSGLALVQGNLVMLQSAMKSVVLGFVCALIIGVVLGVVSPIEELTSEMRSRGGPNLLDLGVAFLSGVAASYCVARPRLSSALAGVAIAAALVPPIATVGISLALRETANAQGAALLFATNVVAIILGSSMNFWVAGIRGKSADGGGALWTRRIWMTLIVLMASLCIPLGSFLVSNLPSPKVDVLRERVEPIVERVVRTQPDMRLEDVVISEDEDKLLVDVTVLSTEVTPQAVVDQMIERLKLEHEGRVEVRVRTLMETRGRSGHSNPAL